MLYVALVEKEDGLLAIVIDGEPGRFSILAVVLDQVGYGHILKITLHRHKFSPLFSGERSEKQEDKVTGEAV
jgi:hypothetical protein